MDAGVGQSGTADSPPALSADERAYLERRVHRRRVARSTIRRIWTAFGLEYTLFAQRRFTL
ncbi:MAG: hypothetical protein EOR84_26100 [Mesorhizobium sp.]|nr:MAG: hypothetical protein EOR84_26100 [Mesorhizobium sp.]